VSECDGCFYGAQREPKKSFSPADARSRSNEIKVVQTRGYSSFRAKKTLRVADAIETFECHRVEWNNDEIAAGTLPIPPLGFDISDIQSRNIPTSSLLRILKVPMTFC